MSAIKVNRVLLAAAIAGFLLVGCKGKGSSGSSIPASLTNWTWEAGTNVANSAGSFGTIGVAATTNQPSGRSGAMSWKDSQGQFWVFSGEGGFSDMWVFNTSNLGWIWKAGANANTSAPGIYGTQGTAAATNMPGARTNGAAWSDTAGNFWLLGGYGTDSSGLIGYLNDLWSYSPASNQWTWVGGSQNGGSGAAVSGFPNPRNLAATWKDASGNFYLFGGQVYLGGTVGVQNDLWQYSPTTNQWTMIGGSTSLNAQGTYGTAGTAAANNQPGARQQPVTWTDNTGNFWMLGGTGLDSAGANGQLNDLWKFNPTTKQWTWVTGSNTINALGNYGTNDVAASTNQPGARSGGIGWTDSLGNLWLFGGTGINASGTLTYLNDLWKFQVSSGQWVWINGSYNGNVGGYYGTISVLSSSNMPGSRLGANGWNDGSGNFWLFGGAGYDAAGSNGRLSDMWKFLP